MTSTTKQFTEKKPTSGYSITPTRTGYRVERWSTAKGDLTDQAWLVSRVSAKRYAPEGQEWGDEFRPYLTRGRMLLRHCEDGGPGVTVVRQGWEVR